MRTSKPNVIWISYDSVRADYMTDKLGIPTPAPTLRTLFDQGIVFDNLWATGSTTQMSMPTFMTGTYPLDCGGYNSGLIHRPKTVSEVMQENGYRTVSWNGGRAGSLEGGYERGYDEFNRNWSLNGFLEHISRVSSFYYHHTKSGRIPVSDGARAFEPFLAIFNEQAQLHAQQNLHALESGQRQPSINTDYPAEYWKFILRLNEGFTRKFNRNRRKACESIVTWRDRFSLHYRLKNKVLRALGRPEDGWIPTIHYMTWLQSYTASKKLARCKELAFSEKTTQIPYQSEQMDFPSLGYFVDQMEDWLKAPQTKPFFAYMVTCDTHLKWNWLTYESSENKARIQEESEAIRNYLESVKTASGFRNDKEIKYLSSIKYTDLQTQRLIEILKKRGLYDNTVFILTSDHGTTAPELPQRPSRATPDEWWDEVFKVPAAIVGSGISHQRIPSYLSTVDFPSTALDALDLPIPTEYRGHSALGESARGRDFVLMENMGMGICDFNWRMMNLTIRTDGWKLVSKFPGRKLNESPILSECYNLSEDPSELTNLAPQRVNADTKRLQAFLTDRASNILSEAQSLGY